MPRILFLTVRFHDGRYHGTGDWPPSPARLFQALVAGIGQDGPLTEPASAPLEWLETLDPPVIAAPRMTPGTTIPKHYVPNNDLDAFGGSVHDLPKTRSAFKVWKPRLFDQEVPFHYAWAFAESDDLLRHAGRVCEVAERLYQLGRGIDQAWAFGEILQPQELEERLRDYPGVVHRPTGGRSDTVLAIPQPGSLKSLKERHEAMHQRFRPQGRGRTIRFQFAKAPEPRFTSATYNCSPTRQLFEIRSRTPQADRYAWPLSQVGSLVAAVRDVVVGRLSGALPEQKPEIERCLIGRLANGSDSPKSSRVRILPLPSIGHAHADHAVRRVLVEIPAACPLRADDILWAVSGLELTSPGSQGEPNLVLTRTADDSMLGHYGVGHPGYRRWRTVTPAALPETARRRRIEPTRLREEAKPGLERAGEQQRAAREVVQALRHAEIPVGVNIIRVQREPFETNGQRVEVFAPGTRFQKEQLWHVELIFQEPFAGPLIIGDGRYYGLGLLAPVRDWEAAVANRNRQT